MDGKQNTSASANSSASFFSDTLPRNFIFSFPSAAFFSFLVSGPVPAIKSLKFPSTILEAATRYFNPLYSTCLPTNRKVIVSFFKADFSFFSFLFANISSNCFCLSFNMHKCSISTFSLYFLKNLLPSTYFSLLASIRSALFRSL